MPEGDVTGTAPHLVPDTLDLATASRLAIDGLLGSLDPEADCEPYFLAFFMANSPCLLQRSWMYSGFCQSRSKPSRFFVLPAATRMERISSSACSKRSPRPSTTTA